MDCLLSPTRGCGGSSSPTKSRSIKQQFSLKRRSDEHAQEPPREWPVDASCYELLGYAGRGAHAVVYRGRCKGFEEEVAIKRLDLDCNWDLSALIREATLMKRFNHPAVLPLHAAFLSGRELWMVTPFMALGSLRNIMKQHFPLGLDEVAIASIMRPVLLALEYVHKNNGIHRDVKADNILMSAEGEVKLADFGVAAARTRAVSMVNMNTPALLATTFVGTPCWMAPEVMQQAEGYNTAADIWSFGITLIELARGRPPLARCNPMRVLIDTLHKPPPQLEDPTGEQYSRAFKEAVEACLNKDPTLRPTASALLGFRFFKMAHDAQFLREHLLAGLPSAVPQQQGQQQQGQQPLPAEHPGHQQGQLAGDGAPPWGPNTGAAAGDGRALPSLGRPAAPAAAPAPAAPAAGPSPFSPSTAQLPQLGQPEGLPRLPANAALQRGGSFDSGPPSSGPSRKLSSWTFPSALFPASMHLHSQLEPALEVEGEGVEEEAGAAAAAAAAASAGGSASAPAPDLADGTEAGASDGAHDGALGVMEAMLAGAAALPAPGAAAASCAGLRASSCSTSGPSWSGAGVVPGMFQPGSGAMAASEAAAEAFLAEMHAAEADAAGSDSNSSSDGAAGSGAWLRGFVALELRDELRATSGRGSVQPAAAAAAHGAAPQGAGAAQVAATDSVSQRPASWLAGLALCTAAGSFESRHGPTPDGAHAAAAAAAAASAYLDEALPSEPACNAGSDASSSSTCRERLAQLQAQDGMQTVLGCLEAAAAAAGAGAKGLPLEAPAAAVAADGGIPANQGASWLAGVTLCSAQEQEQEQPPAASCQATEGAGAGSDAACAVAGAAFHVPVSPGRREPPASAQGSGSNSNTVGDSGANSTDEPDAAPLDSGCVVQVGLVIAPLDGKAGGLGAGCGTAGEGAATTAAAGAHPGRHAT